MNARRAALPAVAMLAVFVSLAGYGVALWKSPATRFDDSYMFVRYANSILAGRGHAWNPDGVQTFGSTSLLHTAVVTVLKWCGPRLDDARLLLIASALPGALTLLALVVTCARCSTGRLLRNGYLLWAGLLLPWLALNGTLLYHHRTGMDTMLATLCNVLLIWAAMRAASDLGMRRMVPLVALSYLTFLARPDNGIYATLFPALCIMLLGNGNLGSGPRRRWCVVFLSGMAAVLTVDAAAKWLVFGSPLPLPFYAKQHGAYEGYANPEGPNPFFFLATFLAVAMPFVCAILLLARKTAAKALIALLLPAVLTLAYYFSVNQIMGAAARFYIPSLPFFVVGAAVVVDDRLQARGRRGILGRSELIWRITLTLLVLAAGGKMLGRAAAWYQGTLSEGAAADGDRKYTTAAGSPLPAMDRWTAIESMAAIAAGAPADTVIALSEHGWVGAQAPHVTLIDLVGLHDRQFAMHGFSAEGLFERNPDLIWLPHYHYTKILAGILESDEFWAHYDFYPGAFDYGIAIRRRGPRFDELSSLVRGRWEAAYGELAPEQYLAVPVR